MEYARKTFLTSEAWTETYPVDQLDNRENRGKQTLARRMTLTSSPIQVTKQNFSRNE